MSDQASDIILILNAGSSSIKFALFSAEGVPSASNLLCDGQLSGIGHSIKFEVQDGDHQPLVDVKLPDSTSHEQAMSTLLEWVTKQFGKCKLVAAGHRVVHGGERYISPTIIDDTVLAELRLLIPLAPLHQPHHIAAIVALQKLYPALVQVACFDTAFHHTNPAVSTRYAIPGALSESGIRRYGFHGLSYEYIASVMEQAMGSELAQGRVVVAHLGSGASMCAMLNRQSVASTMGFTALDGLPMSRRCGSIDPGVVLYLMQEKQMSAEQVSHLLYNDCGLLGVSGISDDMRTLMASDDVHAQEAIDLFVYRINRELGSLVAALGGLDALIFTAGIGEHAALIRSKVLQATSWLGLDVDPDANSAVQGKYGASARISNKQAQTSAWVIPTNEDLMIAQHTRCLLFK
jgi:acetate kinase